jgi:hypothetical protein
MERSISAGHHMALLSFERRRKDFGGADAELELGGPRAGHSRERAVHLAAALAWSSGGS